MLFKIFCYVCKADIGPAALRNDDDIGAFQLPGSPVQPDRFADEALDPVAPYSVSVFSAYRKAEAGVIHAVPATEHDETPGVPLHPAGVGCAEIFRPPQVKVLRKGELSHGGRLKRTAAFFPFAAAGL